MNRLTLFLATALLAVIPTAAPAKAHKAAGETYTFAVYGDCRTNDDAHRKVVAEILAMSPKPEFLIQTGDLVARGANAQLWTTYDSIVAPFKEANIVDYPVRGNHDVGGDSAFTSRVPDGIETTDPSKFYYAFTAHQDRFVVADSEEPHDSSSPQYKWLEAELKADQGKYTNVFVFFHKPPYSVGSHGPNVEIQQTLVPLFVKYQPRIVFNGHDHLYYRTVRAGVNYIVSGGGGAPPYYPVNAPAAIAGDFYIQAVDSDGKPMSIDDQKASADAKDANWQKYADNIYHALLCQVDGDTVTITAIRTDGSVIDKYVVRGN